MSKSFVVYTKSGEPVAQIDANTFAKIMEANRGEMQLVQSPKGRGVSAWVVTIPHSYDVEAPALGTDISIAFNVGTRIFRVQDVL